MARPENGEPNRGNFDPRTGQYQRTGEHQFDPNVMRHEYRELSEQENLTVRQLKDKGRDLVEFLDTKVKGDGRGIAIARTKLEEAIMWAVKAVTG